ncbi:MAG: pyridoxamine 5'-phosphate oxidase family protein [Bacteroidota bacterium]
MKNTSQEIYDEKIMGEILAGAEFCRISMMDGDRPYTLPLTYGYKDKCIYINSAPKGKKIEILSRNPEVDFEIQCTAERSTSCQSLVGRGTVEIISDSTGKQNGMEVILSQQGSSYISDFDPKDMEYVVILKLNIDSLKKKQSGTYYKQGSRNGSPCKV